MDPLASPLSPPGKSRAACTGLILFGLTASPSIAGPNAGGTLVLHAEPDLEYSVGSDYCGVSTATECVDIVASQAAVTEAPILLHVLALFPSEAQPRLSAVGFGLSYDAGFGITAFGPCGDLEISDTAWPEAGTGTAVSWTQPRTTTVVEAYWIAGYAYSATAVALTPHPLHGSWFADDAVPSELDPIAGLGVFGIGVAGSAPCPGVGDGPGGSEDDPPDDEGPLGDGDAPEDGGGSGDEPSPPEGTPLDQVTICVPPEALLYEPTSSASFSPQEADFFVPELRTDLAQAGVIGIEKAVPWRTHADTLALDRWGRTVRIPDVSRYFLLELADAPAATVAETSLRGSVWVSSATQDYAYPVATPYTNDPEFQGSGDPQWYLNNTGARGTAGADLHMPLGVYWPWTIPPGGKTFRIGHIDVGILDHHEDLTVLPGTGSPLRQHLSAHPDLEPCGSHGTSMAGIAAARTNNALGIAGVCSTCEVLDLEMCWSSAPCLDGTCEHVKFTGSILAYALDEYGDPGIDVLLYEGGGSRYLPGLEQDLLYDAYVRGIVTFAPAGNGKGTEPAADPRLAGFPVVVGVGGFTIDGAFWGGDACPSGSEVGSGKVDVAGPACSGEIGAPTTHFSGPDVYRWTRMFTSGATAAVAGAATLAQTIQENTRAGWGLYSSDFYAGIVINSTRPFGGVDTLLTTYGCQDCVLEDFGHGILDVNRLINQTLRMGLHPEELHTHVVRYGDAGTLFEPASEALEAAGGSSQKFYRLWKLYQHSFVPIAGGWDSYIAWPNHIASHDGIATTTPLWHQSILNSDINARAGWMDHMRTAGLTACELSIPEPTTGQVTLTGYTVELLEDDGATHRGWMFEPESLVMSYTYYSDLAPASSPPAGNTTGRSSPSLLVERNPGPGPMAFRALGDAGPGVHLEVFDAGGRLVWSRPWAEIANRDGIALWRCQDDQGRPLPSGLYWGRLHGPDGSSTRKIVIVR